MPQDFETHATGLTSPGRRLLAVIKSDTADLAGGTCRALLVGTAGSANLVDAAGVTHANVPLQQGYNPIMVRRVATGGTATNIWALY